MFKELLASIKEVVLDYVKHRLFPVTVIIIILFSILIRRLFVLQIVEGEEHQDNFKYKSEKTLVVDSVRGKILDRNGKVLAYNELSYSVIYSNDPNISNYANELGVEENELKNQVVHRTINILEENGDSLSVDIPLEIKASGELKFKVKDTQLKSFLRDVYSATSYDDLSEEKKNQSADEVFEYLCEDLFEISDEYTTEEKLKILAVRYKLWQNRYQQYVPVSIAYDISEESNAAITENVDTLYGIDVSVKSLRKYNYAESLAHIIGYIGEISPDELEEKNESLDDDLKYTAGEMIGKAGIEQYGEDYLRGENGYETMYVDNLGKVIELVDSKKATAGNDIYLTIDVDLQKYCYDTLEKEIASILLAKIVNMTSVEPGENADIPITDVYFALFNNNIISLDDMELDTSCAHEKQIYSNFKSKKEDTINKLDDILNVSHTPLHSLSTTYQNYMEYICEILSANDIYNPNIISKEDSVFIQYTTDQISLCEFLKYAIDKEAIDISSLDAKTNYYDTDEIYNILCEYVIKYLDSDTNFDKLIVQDMIKSYEITGYDIVDLIYEQGILNAEGDVEYNDLKNGVYGPYDYMLRKIKKLEITPAMLALDPCSGATVVTDVNTGDVLALVSYPGYDNNKLTNSINTEYYNKLLEDKTSPMYSRATQQQTAPGSTFKIVVSIAGLSENIITNGTVFNCTGVFDKIDPEAHCWIYPDAHGTLGVEEAIQRSCNDYFYNVGYNLALNEAGIYEDDYGLNRLRTYAEEFGLGDLSGVELPEVMPNISDNDAVRSSIGQGKNLYAPIQLSRYVTTVANNGTCYNLTLIDKVTDYEGNIILDNAATVRNTVNIDQTIWNTVHSGMRRVITESVSDTALLNNIDVAVAGKSGTAQESKYRPDHAVYISYAPYDNPEVSVTCVITNGYSSGNVMELSGFIYAYMYDPEKLIGAEMSGNTMISD